MSTGGAANEPSGRSAWIAGLLVAAAVVATYSPVIGLDFVYDDEVLLVSAPPAESVADYVSIFSERRWPTLPYYRPVAWTTLAAQHQLHGLVPTPFHLANLLIAVAAALACAALFRHPAFGIPRPAAFVGAAIFALHPLASSVVFPVAGREALLATVFGIACIAAFLRGSRGLSAVCFALALLSKEQSVSVLPVLAWADLLRLAPAAPGWSPARWIGRYLVFALVLVAYVLARSAILPSGGLEVAVLDTPAGPLFSLLYTLQTTFAPFAELVYEPPLDVWPSTERLLLVLAAVAAVGIGVARQGQAQVTAAAFFLGLALLSLAPSANLIVQESMFAERYGWFPLAGWTGIVLVAAPGLGTRWQKPAAILVLAACAVVSFQRGRYYADDETFLGQWLETNPRSLQARVALGGEARARGALREAIEHYERALDEHPDSPLAHAALGEALLAQRRPAHALEHTRRAAQLAPDDPQFHHLLGINRLRLGDPEGAAAASRRALSLFPEFAHAHNTLAAALQEEGRFDEARRSLERAVELAPGYVAARVNLAERLVDDGDVADGIAQYRRALEIAPGAWNASLGLSRALSTAEDPSLRDPSEALRLAMSVVEAVDGPAPRAFAAVAAAQASRGDLRAAAAWQERAVRAAPPAMKPDAEATLARYREALASTGSEAPRAKDD